MEPFFSPNSGEDQQKKDLHQTWNTFFPPQIQVKTNKKKIFTKNGPLFFPLQIQVKTKKKGLYQTWTTFFP